MTARRQFIQWIPVAGLAALASRQVQAQVKLDEKDAQAAALGYVADATKTNKTKFKNYAAGQICGNCALFAGKAGEAWGNCPLFAGKQVAAAGWCSAYAKKG